MVTHKKKKKFAHCGWERGLSQQYHLSYQILNRPKYSVQTGSIATRGAVLVHYTVFSLFGTTKNITLVFRGTSIYRATGMGVICCLTQGLRKRDQHPDHVRHTDIHYAFDSSAPGDPSDVNTSLLLTKKYRLWSPALVQQYEYQFCNGPWLALQI